MQKDVLRGMIEAKHMLRDVFGTKNTYTYGVAGTGFSGLDCVLSLILPGDKVVAFINGTFSGIDGLTIRMKASTGGARRKPAQPGAGQRRYSQCAAWSIGRRGCRRCGARRAQANVGVHGPLGDRQGAVNDLRGFQRRLPSTQGDGHRRRGVQSRRR